MSAGNVTTIPRFWVEISLDGGPVRQKVRTANYMKNSLFRKSLDRN